MGPPPPSFALLVFSILSPGPICPEHNNHLGFGFGSGLGRGLHEQFFVLVTASESNPWVAMRTETALGRQTVWWGRATEQNLHLECSSASQAHPEGLRGAATSSSWDCPQPFVFLLRVTSSVCWELGPTPGYSQQLWNSMKPGSRRHAHTLWFKSTLLIVLKATFKYKKKMACQTFFFFFIFFFFQEKQATENGIFTHREGVPPTPPGPSRGPAYPDR